MAFQPEPVLPDLDRLKVTLLKSGIQQKDQPLYQVINQLIDFLRKSIGILQSDVAAVSGGGGSTATTQIIQQLLLDGDSGGDGGDTIPGPQGEPGENGMVPYFIAASETFTVPEFKQALFAMNIDNEGILIIDGFLIEVDDSDTLPYAQLSDTTTQAPGVTTPVLVTFNTEDELVAITHSGGNITILTSGIYQIIAGGQIGEVNNGKVNVDLWLKVNGSNVANSGVRNTISLNTDTKVVILNYILPLVVGDVVNVYMSVDDATKGAGLIPATPAGEAAIPSIMLTICKIGHV